MFVQANNDNNKGSHLPALYDGDPPLTGWFPSPMASKVFSYNDVVIVFYLFDLTNMNQECGKMHRLNPFSGDATQA